MKIYLASPYSHRDPAVRQMRYDLACAAAAKIMARGYRVFSPIAHSHSVGVYLPEHLLLDFDFWMRQDLCYISDWADIVVILMLDGWNQSRGVQREMEFCQEQNVRVHCLATDSVFNDSWVLV